MAWRHSHSQASRRAGKSEQDSSRPRDLPPIQRVEDRALLRPLPGVAVTRQPRAFRRRCGAQGNTGTPLRDGGTTTLRGHNKHVIDADIPNGRDISANRCRGNIKPLQHSRFRRHKQRPQNRSLDCLQAEAKKGPCLARRVRNRGGYALPSTAALLPRSLRALCRARSAMLVVLTRQLRAPCGMKTGCQIFH